MLIRLKKETIDYLESLGVEVNAKGVNDFIVGMHVDDVSVNLNETVKRIESKIDTMLSPSLKSPTPSPAFSSPSPAFNSSHSSNKFSEKQMVYINRAVDNCVKNIGFDGFDQNEHRYITSTRDWQSLEWLGVEAQVEFSSLVKKKLDGMEIDHSLFVFDA